MWKYQPVRRSAYFIRATAYYLVLRIGIANCDPYWAGNAISLLEENNAWPVNLFEPPRPMCALAVAHRSQWPHKT
jgi:hypothetical protein